jgi:Ser/Thr protein kinase RdoA (MazF antagonist)
LNGSAAGPSGTRASHLLHAIQVNNPTSALDTLTDFVNHLASGAVPSVVQPFLSGAYLVGLSKKMEEFALLLLEMFIGD